MAFVVRITNWNWNVLEEPPHSNGCGRSQRLLNILIAALPTYTRMYAKRCAYLTLRIRNMMKHAKIKISSQPKPRQTPLAYGSAASGCAASFLFSLFNLASCSTLNLTDCEFSHMSSRSRTGSSPTGTSAIARVGKANSAFPLVADFTSRRKPTPAL